MPPLVASFLLPSSFGFMPLLLLFFIDFVAIFYPSFSNSFFGFWLSTYFTCLLLLPTSSVHFSIFIFFLLLRSLFNFASPSFLLFITPFLSPFYATFFVNVFFSPLFLMFFCFSFFAFYNSLPSPLLHLYVRFLFLFSSFCFPLRLFLSHFSYLFLFSLLTPFLR